MNAERKLDQQIDGLLAGRQPDAGGDAEMAGLLAMAREVRLLSEPPQARRRPRWMGLRAALTAVAALFLIVLLAPGFGQRNVVLAMEKALAELHSYHGVLEASWESPEGTGSEQTEIWWAGDRYKVVTPQHGIWYSDGDYRWTVHHDQSRAQKSLALGTGEEFQPWDIRLMAKYALKYPARTVAHETVAGRKTVKLELARAGGDPWYLWLDAETNLPLQFTRRTDSQETFRFVRFEANPELPDDLFTYTPPAHYAVQVADERWVDSVAEAASVKGFTPLLPQEGPRRVAVTAHSIVLDYGDTLIYQQKTEQFKAPIGWGDLKGKAAGSTVYVQGDGHLRWYQQGIDIAMSGSRTVELARQIAPDLTLPDPAQDLVSAAQVKVAVEMTEANRVQRLMDAYREDHHHSYPVAAAAAFVNGLSHPGVDRPTAQVAEWEFEEEANTGVEAIVTTAKGPISRIYVKRVVRQDHSGAWFVVGYDRR